MCEPTTIAMSAMAISGGLQAYGQYQQGRAMKDAANVRADLNEAAADDARARGQQEASRKRTQIQRMLGRQRTAMAASGVDIGTGTSLELFEETARLGEFDAQIIENNAAREAWGYETEAVMSDWEGKQAKRAGTIGAGATLLGTGGSMAMMSGGGGGGGTQYGTFARSRKMSVQGKGGLF